MPDNAGFQTLDELARARGITRPVEAPGSPLPKAEQERLAKMDSVARFWEGHFARRPIDGGIGGPTELVVDPQPVVAEWERLAREIEARSGGRTRIIRDHRGRLVSVDREDDGTETRTVLGPKVDVGLPSA